MSTLTTVLKRAIDFQLSSVNTCLPGQILSYDYQSQKAQVQPVLKATYPDGDVLEAPVINNVPVIFPRSGGAGLTFPVAKGDYCLLLFSQRSLDEWLSQGGVVSPQDFRQFDLSDAIAIMGIFPFVDSSTAENNDDVLLTYQGSKIRIKADGSIVIQTAQKVAIGTPTVEVLNVISQTLNLLATSLTTSVGSPFSNASAWASLRTQIETIRGTIP